VGKDMEQKLVKIKIVGDLSDITDMVRILNQSKRIKNISVGKSKQRKRHLRSYGKYEVSATYRIKEGHGISDNLQKD
jgi:hypothetical protein